MHRGQAVEPRGHEDHPAPRLHDNIMDIQIPRGLADLRHIQPIVPLMDLARPQEFSSRQSWYSEFIHRVCPSAHRPMQRLKVRSKTASSPSGFLPKSSSLPV